MLVAERVEPNHESDPNCTTRAVRGKRTSRATGGTGAAALVLLVALLLALVPAGAAGAAPVPGPVVVPPDAGAVMPGIDAHLLGVALQPATGGDASAALAAAQTRLAALRTEQRVLEARRRDLAARSLELTAAQRQAQATLERTQAMVDRVAAAAYKSANDELFAVLPSKDMLDLSRRMKLAGQAGTSLREISQAAKDARRRATRAGQKTAVEASRVDQRLGELAPDLSVAEREMQARLSQAASDLPARKVAGLGIPVAALDAYLRSERVLALLQPTCGLEWWMIAGIADGESGHGTHGGARADVHGDVFPVIIGIPLDGTHDTQPVGDSDHGLLDTDPVWDRAVGALQFTPGTWHRWASDGNGDGKSDPQNLYDAALAAGRKLCADAGAAGLHTDPQLAAALKPYVVTNALVKAKLARAREYQRQGIPAPDPSVAGAIPTG